MLALCLRAGRVLRLCRALDGAGSRAGVRRTQKGGDGLVQRITVVPNRPTSRRADTPQQPHTVSPSSGCAHRHPRTSRGQPGTHKPSEGGQVGTQAPTNQHRLARWAPRHPQTSRGQSDRHPGTHKPARAARPATRLRLLYN